MFECTFSAINQKLLLPLLSASRAYVCACVCLCVFLRVCISDLAFYCCNANTNLYWHRKGKNLCRRNSLHSFPSLHASSPHTLSHTHTHIDPCEKRGVVKRVCTPFPLTPQPQSHMQCQYLYLLSMRVARKWRLPFVGFRCPLSPSPPLLVDALLVVNVVFFCTLFYDLGFMWALKQWLSVARLGHIQRVFYSAMKVFFILFLDIGKSLCHTYTYACARICVCVCVSDMSANGSWYSSLGIANAPLSNYSFIIFFLLRLSKSENNYLLLWMSLWLRRQIGFNKYIFYIGNI